MFFHVLGPVQIGAQERRFSAGSRKEQSVLAILLLEAGRVVSAQGLAERLWDDRMPGKARETLQVYVSRLRRRLREAGDEFGLIVSSPAGGYRLDASVEQVDVRQFEALVSQARSAVAGRDPLRASALLRHAEQLWAGEPLEGLTGQWAESTRRSLLEKRRAAHLARIDLDLHAEVGVDDLIGELEALSYTGIVDQRVTGLQMRALEQVGRQDEALEVFRRLRKHLRDELAIEPRRELQELHARILRGDQEAHGRAGSGGGVPRAGVADNTLDRDPALLTGREELAQELVNAVLLEVQSGSGMAVYALDGMPGVGKSALAVHVAHRLAGGFPDGVLQVNLRTHDPRHAPLDVRTGLVQLLEALATPVHDVGRAQSLDALATLWRRRSSGRRLLVVLDDIAGFEDISPMFPASAVSAVLVTSRRRLSDLAGAWQVTVAPLPQEASVRLLERITGRSFERQQGDAHLFADKCGGLPLAVTVAAAYLRSHPSWRLADLVERLDAALVKLAPDDHVTGPVAVALSLSYRALSTPRRALLRRVATLPGQEFSLFAAAAAQGDSPDHVDLALDILVENNLVQETQRRRYRLHDLVRAYALAQIAREDEDQDARAGIGRAVDFYIATAAHAEFTLRPDRKPAERGLAAQWAEPHFADRTSALAWMALESENLLHLLSGQFVSDAPDLLISLAGITAKHLDRTGRWPQAIEILQHAVHAAVEAASPLLVQAELMADLAAACIRIRDYPAALGHAQRALEIFSAAGDLRGQADALLEVGRIHRIANRLAQADAALELSGECYERSANERGRAAAHVQRAIAAFEGGHHRQAMELTMRAIETAQVLEDDAVLCDALTNLGEIHHRLGDDNGALAHYRNAQPVARRIADPHNLAMLAGNMAAAYNGIGQHAQALESFGQAMRLFGALEDHSGQSEVLLGMVDVHCDLGDHAAAAQYLLRAARLADLCGDELLHYRVAMARGRLADVTRENAQALLAYQSAVEHAQSAGILLEQARALRALADACMVGGDQHAAELHQRRAARIDWTLEQENTSS